MDRRIYTLGSQITQDVEKVENYKNFNSGRGREGDIRSAKEGGGGEG